MDEKGIKRFFSDRVPLSGRLSDYALLIGQNNRVLQSVLTTVAAASSITLPPRQNRVGLSVTAVYGLAVTPFSARVSFNAVTGNDILRHELARRIVNSLGNEVINVIYKPLFLNVTQFGPAIQRAIVLGNPDNDITVFANEILMTPVCCDYIGGME